MSEKKYTVVLLNDGGITSEMINAINVVMGSFNMFLGGSESIRSDGSYILAKDVSEDIAYALKQGIEASGGQVEIFDDKTNTESPIYFEQRICYNMMIKKGGHLFL